MNYSLFQTETELLLSQLYVRTLLLEWRFKIEILSTSSVFGTLRGWTYFFRDGRSRTTWYCLKRKWERLDKVSSIGQKLRGSSKNVGSCFVLILTLSRPSWGCKTCYPVPIHIPLRSIPLVVWCPTNVRLVKILSQVHLKIVTFSQGRLNNGVRRMKKLSEIHVSPTRKCQITMCIDGRYIWVELLRTSQDL